MNLDNILPDQTLSQGRRLLNMDALAQRTNRRNATTPHLVQLSAQARLEKWELEETERWAEIVPRRWKKAKIEDFEENLANFANTIVNRIHTGNPLSSFVLWSPITGSGKTYLTYAILNRLHALKLVTSRNVSLVNEATIADIAIAGFDREEKLSDLLNGKKVIFVDDMSGRAKYGWNTSNASNREATWFDILDHAYSHGSYVFMTSNVDSHKLKALMGDAAYDRLYHLTSSGEYIQHIERESYRRKIAQRVNNAYR